MDKGRIVIFAMLAAITIVLAVFASFVFGTQADSEAPVIELPPEVQDNFTPGQTDVFQSAPPESVVTSDNIADLVNSLERPEDYYATITVEQFWQGGSSLQLREVWSSDGFQLIKSYAADGTLDNNCIVAGENTYIWRDNETQYYLGATGRFSPDDAAQIPTYEDLAELEPSVVTECGYEASGDIPCLVVETIDDLGQTNRWWVALSSGLLWKFETWDEGELVYRMQTLSLSTDAVDRGQFILPDGNSAFDLG